MALISEGEKLMMKCPNCGGDRYLNDGGCRNCGSDLSGLEIVEENSLNQNVKPTQAKLSRLCFAGFVLSVSSFIFAVAGYMALPVFSNEIASLVFQIASILSFLSGFIISIIGVRSARKKGERGRAFGVVGIIYACARTVHIILILHFVLTMISGGFIGSGPNPNNTPEYSWTTQTYVEDTTFYP